MSDIDGITVELHDNCILCRVEDLSDQLKGIIRSKLIRICQGQYRAEHEALVYTYKATIQQLIERLENKSKSLKIGMIGELIFHTLWDEYKSNFVTLSPYFNLEENNVKKGFDLVLMNRDDELLWLVEVKSGQKNDKESVTEKAVTLIDLAKNDISSPSTLNKVNRWYNALNGLTIAHQGNNETDIVKKILEGNFAKAPADEVKAEDQNVILVSGLFFQLDDQIEAETVIAKHLEIKAAKTFNKCWLFSFHKATFEKVIEFLIEEGRSV